jgi:hypothetical protein|tara:strand:- start:448 stop:750 length:303 start_codon:yes stop_codon:yes gene_type:complete
MAETHIKLPTWALPIIAALVSFSIGYGAMQAQAQATQIEIERVGKIAVDTYAKSNENATSTALNAQAIKNIADSLARQEKLAEASDARLTQLINMMLERK